MRHFHKNIRLTATNYVGQRWYFVTLCCEAKQRRFASATLADVVIKHLKHIAIEHLFTLYAYCLMPDHLHVLVHGDHVSSDLLAFVNVFKKNTSFEYANRANEVLWQKKFYDRILRPGDRVAPFAAYIWLNPVRAGLCANPKSYPFSGSQVVDWPSVKISPEVCLPPWKLNAKAPA